MKCKLLLGLLALTLATPALAAEKKAGVQIGAKGVLGLVVEFDARNPEQPVAIRYSKTANTTLMALVDGKFRPEAIDETIEVVARLLQEMEKEHGIDLKTVPVVGSSGLLPARNREDLVRAIKDKFGKNLTFIDAATEVRLLLDGLVLQNERASALVIDLGSGNLKGGCLLLSDGKLVTFDIPLGTVTFTTRVRDVGGPARKVADAEVLPVLMARAKDHPELKQRDPVVLVGGGVWAMATILYPEKVGQSRVALNVEDFDRYIARLTESPKAFPEVDLSGIADAALRDRAAKELSKVKAVFTPENLIAGAELLRATGQAFELKGKKVEFNRNGQVAWLLGLVAPPDAIPVPVPVPMTIRPSVPIPVPAPVTITYYYPAPVFVQPVCVPVVRIVAVSRCCCGPACNCCRR